MTESSRATQGTPVPNNSNAELQAGLIDVLIRGLEATKRSLNGTTDGPESRDFCLLLYAKPGDGCILGYFHRPPQ